MNTRSLLVLLLLTSIFLATRPSPPAPAPLPLPVIPEPPAPPPSPVPDAVDSLDEVNIERAKKSLYPFERDAGLTLAAMKAAHQRALELREGHLDNDFACLPEGSHADCTGCAAWPPEWG